MLIFVASLTLLALSCLQTITAEKPPSQFPTAAPSFAPTSYSAANTNTTRRNYVTAGPFHVCPTQEFTATVCQSPGSYFGDTFFRLMDDDGNQLLENDDACGSTNGGGSEIVYRPCSSCSCEDVYLHMGCFADTACSGNVYMLTVDDKESYIKALPPVLDYWGAYLGLFGGIYLLMGCISATGYFDKFVKRCTLAACKTAEAELLMDEATKAEVVENHLFEETYLKKKVNTEVIQVKEVELPWYRQICCICCSLLDGFRTLVLRAVNEYPYNRKFPKSFVKGLLDDRCYYGIDFDDSSEHSWLKKTCLSSLIGHQLYDMLFYICNSNPTFSMALSSDAHPLSRSKKRNAFFIINAFSLLFCMLFVLIDTYYWMIYAEQGHDDKYINKKLTSYGYMWNFLFVLPVMYISEKLMFYIQACPCLIKQTDSHFRERCNQAMRGVAKLISFYLAFAAFFIYYVSAILAGGYEMFISIAAYYGYTREEANPGFEVLGQFMYEVFVTSQAVHLFLTIAKFQFGYYNFKLCCCSVFTLGVWDKERVIHFFYRTNADALNNKSKYKDEEAFIDSICDSKSIIPFILKVEFMKKDVLDSMNSNLIARGNLEIKQVNVVSVVAHSGDTSGASDKSHEGFNAL